MNKRLSKFLQISLPLALGIFLTWYVYSRFTPEQLDEVYTHFSEANYWMVGLAVFLSMFSHVLRAYRWNFQLEPLGYQPRLLNNFMAVSIAYLMNIFIPKSGEVSRAVVINKYEKVPFDKAFGTIISERVVDLVFLMLYTAIAFSVNFDTLYNYLNEQGVLSKVAYLLAVGLVALLLLFILLKFVKSPMITRLLNFLSGLKEGVLSILHMRKKGMFLLHTVLIWSLYLLSFYAATKALVPTSDIDFGTLVITFVLGSFTFAFTNSGFGTYPYVVAGILFVFGVSETVGTAFGWIIWTSNIASLVFFGALSLIFLPIYNRRSLPSNEAL